MEQFHIITNVVIIIFWCVIIYAGFKQDKAWKRLLENHREWSNHEINVLRGRIKHLEVDINNLIDYKIKHQAQAKQPTTVSRKPRKVKQ